MSRKKSASQYREEFTKATNGEYLLLEEYTNARTNVLVKHMKCGYTFRTSPNKFLKTLPCRECSKYTRKYNRKRTIEEAKNDIANAHNREYEMINNAYNNKYTKILALHTTCNTEFEVIYHDLLQGKSGCPTCYAKTMQELHRKTSDEFVKEFESITNEYKLLGEYVGSDKSIRIKHIACGRSFNPTPNNFLRGSRCPHCNESKGEKRVRQILESLEFDYLTEYRFKDCKNKASLPFDFYIPDVNTCIEYDGEFHYKETPLGNDLKRQQLHDKIKDDYCYSNNIKLIRIPYWEYRNIKTILTNKLIKTIPSEA